jgi:hypothetical protein
MNLNHEIYTKEKKNVLYLLKDKRRGQGFFGIVKKQNNNLFCGHWENCRDRFHRIRWSSIILYKHGRGWGKHIAAFINKIELHLNINPISQFGPTNQRTVTWIKYSRWWLKNRIRKGFFTVALRAALNYNLKIDNWEEVLFDCKYVKWTALATRRFLKGYTEFNGKDTGGWCWTLERSWVMNQKDYQKRINKMLIKDLPPVLPKSCHQ